MKQLFAKAIGLYLNLLAYIAPRSAGELGFYIFCKPQRAAIKDHQQAFLDTAEKSSFLHDGYRIQVYRWGNGKKKVLFLHGWQSHSFRWKNYIESFDPAAFTLYAFDAPGHGRSGGKYLNLPIYGVVLETVISLLGPFDAIVSHSLGSFAALYTFYRKSPSVRELVITSTPGEVEEFFQYYKRALGLTHRADRILREAFRRILDENIDYFSAPKFASALQISGLIIHDQDDRETPIHHAEAIHAAWKGSTMITTSGLGHNLRSAQVVRLIVDYLSPKAVEASARQLLYTEPSLN